MPHRLPAIGKCLHEMRQTVTVSHHAVDAEIPHHGGMELVGALRTARAADSGRGPGNAGRMPNRQLLHPFAKPHRHRYGLALTGGTLASTGAKSARGAARPP